MQKEISLIPWLTKDAIDFLDNFFKQNKNAKMLEFGCGGSTVWFCQRTSNLVSIEHNPQWYNKIKNYLNSCKQCNTVDLRLIENDYYKVTDEFPNEYFDLILVDGIQRLKCIQNSIRSLKKNGILMLDNAERKSYKKAYDILKDWKLNKTINLNNNEFGYKNKETNWWIKT